MCEGDGNRDKDYQTRCEGRSIFGSSQGASTASALCDVFSTSIDPYRNAWLRVSMWRRRRWRGGEGRRRGGAYPGRCLHEGVLRALARPGSAETAQGLPAGAPPRPPVAKQP